ncbi:MAG: type I restriction enzyme HsdR N-terminal domain-containing protein [Thermodesulfobacteriota bacterium]|nr:type I restriction enzyme HsdR N-terminal domain-containing protein [Thermodesulfobacteriota bacterium]
MKSGHLKLGELVDFITGETIEDTHDERYRQKLARLFVEKKGYNKNEIKSRCELPVSAGANKAVVKIDFLITLSNKICMIIKYSPGSLVTRHRPVLAASRLVAPYQIPIAVATNGENADVLDGYTNEVISSGFESIPDRQQLAKRVADIQFEHISSRRVEMESRIIYAFEIDGSCSL